MGQSPERTCIGCREVFSKSEVVRIVAGPAGVIVDYREKLPGRAAYVCVNRSCLEKACARDMLSRSLKQKLPAMQSDKLATEIETAVRSKILALLAMAVKAGSLAVGFSAVQDALSKGRVRLLLFAEDISEGTSDKILAAAQGTTVRREKMFSKAEIGATVGREFAGVCAVLEDGFAKAFERECERFKKLAK